MFLSTASSVSGISSTAAAMQKMSISAFLGHEDLLGWIMVITLCVMSISSWYFIIANTMRSAMVRKAADKVVKDFWANASPQEAMHMLEAQPQNEPFSKIALDAIAVAAHHQQAGADGSRLAQALSRSEFIDRALRQAVDREGLRLEGGMTLLATVGSAAPFVGLLGTVWGIYHALIRISASGNASMEAVAGPVGEALVMTAFGLFAAIPAVLAYNALGRSNRVIYARFDEFAHDLHDFFATGARVENK